MDTDAIERGWSAIGGQEMENSAVVFSRRRSYSTCCARADIMKG